MKKNFSLMWICVTMIFVSCQKDDPVVSVENISLNKNTLSLDAGKSEMLVATVMPANAGNKSVTWSSDNKAVADVDARGVVTAKADGTAVITVTSVGNSAKKASCTVTVTTPVIYAVGDLYPDATSPAGVVFTISDGGVHGKVVSLDQTTDINWTDAKAWRSANALPSGMNWTIPTKVELQYLWCAYNGAAPVTWDGGNEPPCPDANGTAQAAFNKIMTDAGGISFSGIYYWSSDQGDTGEAWVVGFVSGLTGIDHENAANGVRNVSAF